MFFHRNGRGMWRCVFPIAELPVIMTGDCSLHITPQPSEQLQVRLLMHGRMSQAYHLICLGVLHNRRVPFGAWELLTLPVMCGDSEWPVS